MNNNKKYIGCIVSVVLAVILCVGALGIVSGGFRDWDYKHWFDKNDIVLDPNGGVVGNSGNELDSSKVKNMTFKSQSLNAVSDGSIEDGGVLAVGNNVTLEVVEDYRGEKFINALNVPYKYEGNANSIFNDFNLYILGSGDVTPKRVKCQHYRDDIYRVPLSGCIDLNVSGLYSITWEATYFLVPHNPSYTSTAPFIYDYISSNPTPLPTPPTKEGYTFVEWCLDEALTIPYDGREVTADLIIYAKFKINSYTVTFNTNGGSAIANQVIDWNTSATLSAPTRTGYDFVGWYIGEFEYTNGAIKADTTLVAKWKIQTFKLTFMLGTEVYKELIVDYGTTLYKSLQVANLSYYKALNTSNEVLSGTEVITSATTVNVVEMTQNEKVGKFLSDNVWILWTAGGTLVVLTMLLAVLISKRRM